ncbi:MAG: MFS transporter [Gammaproteobacteria bacterium]
MSVLRLGAVLSLRMLGLFMIYPIFAALSSHYAGATAFTVGLALGSYGLTQGLLQLPFGWLSDRFGRKRIIIVGLILFAAGSAVAALATTITGLIIGRLFQGFGAIGSATLAMIADVTREEHRVQAMALAGALIGSSFAVAIVLGPLLASAVGLTGIFWLTGVSALLAIPLVMSVRVPGWSHPPTRPRRVAQALRIVLAQPDLVRLDVGIAIQQAVLTSLFLVLPAMSSHLLGITPGMSWKLYLPILAGAFLISLPFVILAEARGWFRMNLLGAILGLGFGIAWLLLDRSSGTDLVVALALYFSAFTLLEALLPSWISRISPVGFSGTALGVYSSGQFLGIFLGGAVGGLVLAHWSEVGVLAFDLLLVGLWFVIAFPIRKVKRTRTIVVPAPDRGDGWGSVLNTVPGVIEWRYVNEEELLYLRLDPDIFSKESLERLQLNQKMGV